MGLPVGGFGIPGSIKGGTTSTPPPTGSTSSGGSGGRANIVERSIAFESDHLVETSISVEKTIVNAVADAAFQVSWLKFPGAQGFRIFKYQKDGSGDRINEEYTDIAPATSYLWTGFVTDNPIGGPKNTNAFNVTPIVRCSHHVDINAVADIGFQTVGAYVKYLLKTFGGRTDAQLNLTSFSDFDAAFPARMKRYIGQQTNIGALIMEVEACTMSYLKPDVDGKLGLYLLDPTKEPVADFTDIDFVLPPIQGSVQRSATYNEVTVDFNQSIITQEVETVSVQTPEADYKYEDNQEFQITSILIDRVANASLASSAAASLKQQSPVLIAQVRTKGFTVTIGDIVTITRNRGYTKTGTYAADKWFVVSTKQNLEKATVELILIKVWADMNKLRKWAPDGIPVWGSATAAQKETYGYWQDASGLVGGDTFKQSVWAPTR